MPPIPPVLIQIRIPQNPEEPGLQVRARGESVGGLERSGKGFLHQILGIGRLSGEVVREVVQRIRIRQGLAAQAGAGIRVP
jgi:hypothetical protein